MENLVVVIIVGCLAAVLGTPPPYGIYGNDYPGGIGIGGGMYGPGGEGGMYGPIGGGGIYGIYGPIGGGGMYGPIGGGGMYGPIGGGGIGGYGYPGFSRPRFCKCRKQCRPWERYMGKCWRCRWYNCRVRCCRF